MTFLEIFIILAVMGGLGFLLGWSTAARNYTEKISLLYIRIARLRHELSEGEIEYPVRSARNETN